MRFYAIHVEQVNKIKLFLLILQTGGRLEKGRKNAIV